MQQTGEVRKLNRPTLLLEQKSDINNINHSPKDNQGQPQRSERNVLSKANASRTIPPAGDTSQSALVAASRDSFAIPK